MGTKSRVSIEGALRFTKLSVYLACTWPPSMIATKWDTTKHDIIIILSITSALFYIIPVLASIYVYRSDSVIVTQSIVHGSIGITYAIKTLVCRVRRKQIQLLTHEMEDFVKSPRPHERMILQYYLDRCWKFHAALSTTVYLAVLAVFCGPLFSEYPLPVVAVYPFSIDSNKAIYFMVYIHQTISGLQMAAGALVDFQVALMMWYAGARLEILTGQLRTVSSVMEFRAFVREHQRLIAYTEKVSETMGAIAFVTSTSSGLGAILGSIQLASNIPSSKKVIFAPIMLASAILLFICAWPAENLLRICDSMTDAAYDACWTNMTTEWMKNCLIVLRRCQRPIKVTVGGFIPSLSFKFYGSFLSAAFSYFTTLRAYMSMD